jgi:hypothetical protein
MTRAYCVFVVVDLSFNIVTTSLIIVRIMIHRAGLRKSIGEQACVVSSLHYIPCSGTRHHGREYISIIAMTTESCMISAISSVIYLILYTIDNFAQYPFMVIQSQMQVRDGITLYTGI